MKLGDGNCRCGLGRRAEERRRSGDLGVEVDPPEDKPYGVRMLTVTDPEINQWGFMHRI
jgi:hypothetical protein